MQSIKQKKILDGKLFYNTKEASQHYLEGKELFPKEKIAFDYIPSNSKILDLGCGTGRTTRFFLEKGHDVTGADISLAMTETARNLCCEVPFLVSDACLLSFKTGIFDVVIFSYNGIDCISPYEKRLKALQEIRRLLKPGGLFIFSSHNHCFPRDRDGVIPFLKTLFKKQRNTYIVDTCHSWGAVKIYLTTPGLQIRELEQSGFELIRLVPRRLLRKIRSPALIGLIDSYVYYVCKSRP